jgi:hypothetical protein
MTQVAFDVGVLEWLEGCKCRVGVEVGDVGGKSGGVDLGLSEEVVAL